MTTQGAWALWNEENLTLGHRNIIKNLRKEDKIQLKPVGRAFLTPNTLENKFGKQALLGKNRITEPGIYIVYTRYAGVEDQIEKICSQPLALIPEGFVGFITNRPELISILNPKNYEWNKEEENFFNTEVFGNPVLTEHDYALGPVGKYDMERRVGKNRKRSFPVFVLRESYSRDSKDKIPAGFNLNHYYLIPDAYTE